MKRQKSVPEDQKKAEEDRGSPTEVDIRRPFEEEVGTYFLFQPTCTNKLVCSAYELCPKRQELGSDVRW